MIKIEVDQEVFGILQAHARPFVDSPNDVLRRLLLPLNDATNALTSVVLNERISAKNPAPDASHHEDKHALQAKAHTPAASSAEEFVQKILSTRFTSRFSKCAGYRMMFESSSDLVYFQNFNKKSDHLWYRITEKPWRELLQSKKNAWIALTNPAEEFGFVIPAQDVLKAVERSGWARQYLEVNIDPATSRWIEMNWDISKYLCR